MSHELTRIEALEQLVEAMRENQRDYNQYVKRVNQECEELDAKLQVLDVQHVRTQENRLATLEEQVLQLYEGLQELQLVSRGLQKAQLNIINGLGREFVLDDPKPGK